MCYSEYLAECVSELSQSSELELCNLILGETSVEALPEFPQGFAVINADGMKTTSIKLVLSAAAEQDRRHCAV